MRIPIDEVDLIKIDCEGCEEVIARSLMLYVAKLIVKPAIYLSLHQFWWQGSLETAEAHIVQLFRRYEFVYAVNPESDNGESLVKHITDFSPLNTELAYVLSDRPWEDLPKPR